MSRLKMSDLDYKHCNKHVKRAYCMDCNCSLLIVLSKTRFSAAQDRYSHCTQTACCPHPNLLLRDMNNDHILTRQETAQQMGCSKMPLFQQHWLAYG